MRETHLVHFVWVTSAGVCSGKRLPTGSVWTARRELQKALEYLVITAKAKQMRSQRPVALVQPSMRGRWQPQKMS
jgi:hypothetical protein